MTLPDAVIDPGFSTAAMSACWSPAARVRAMLDVEIAITHACTAVGLVDAAVATEIAELCARVTVDASGVLREGWEVGTPVVALRDALAPHLSPAAAEALRSGHGTTTQDIVDTAVQLQIRDALGAIVADLGAQQRRLVVLATEHRSTPMIGRTFLQHARPTTFGLRAALWLDAVADVAEQVRAAAAAGRLQFGGPAGVLDELGDLADQVGEHVAAALGLRLPTASWHGDRSRIAEVCSLAGRVARCMAKIATDVALLSSSEIGEIRVRSGTSSSMAGKRNPFDSVRTIAAADACAGVVATVAGARPIELERGIGGWHVEWFAVPLVFMTAAAAVEAMRDCLESLEVDAVAMQRHLDEHPPDQAPGRATERAAVVVERILTRHVPQR